MMAAAAPPRRGARPGGRDRAARDAPVVAGAEAAEAFDGAAARVTRDFTVCGQPCRLVQLVPHAFVVRMTRALDEHGTERRRRPARAGADGARRRAGATVARATSTVRVWAELGRTRMPVGDVAGAAARRGRRARPRGRRPDRPLRQRPALRDRPARAHRRPSGPCGSRACSADRRNPPNRRRVTWHECSSSTTRPSCARWSPTPSTGRPRGDRRGGQRQRGGRPLPGAAARADDARHHDAREGRPRGAARDHRARPRAPA